MPRYTATTIADGIVVVLPPLVEDTKSGSQTVCVGTLMTHLLSPHQTRRPVVKAHVATHVTAVVHSYHPDLFLPPHEQER